MNCLLQTPLKINSQNGSSVFIPFQQKFLLKKIIPFLVFSFFCVSAYSQKNAGVLRLKTGDIAVKENIASPGIAGELQKGKFGSNYYMLLVFDKPVTASQQQKLKTEGIELLQYLPDNSYIVRLNQTPSSLNLFYAGVKAMTYMPGNLKMSKELTETSATVHPETDLSVNLVLQRGVKLIDVQSLLNFYGFAITGKDYSAQGLVQGTIKAGKLNMLSELSFVGYLNLSFMQAQPLNMNERNYYGLSNLISRENAGRNLSGAGVTIGVGDNADPTSHIDNNHVINRNPAPVNLGHGTIVTGTITSNGIVEERYRGVAPKATVISDYFNYILTKAPVYFTDYNMTLTNNSYFVGLANCPGNSDYNELSVFADEQIYNNNVLQHVFACGNDGAKTCSPYPAGYATIKSGFQTAKNVLSVGDFSFSLNGINTTSSKGPVKDGRIKPEIVASGSGVVGTNAINYYTGGFGTSHSSPFITGVCALLTERYKQLNGNAYPKSALLKAVICNSGTDWGNAGPDYIYGFGMINPRKAVETIEQTKYFSNTITTGGSVTQNISVPAGTKQVKVMLYWHDKEGVAFSSSALTNDLDLTVTDGTTYQPWVLNPAPGSVSNPALRGVDHLNNIEQVTYNNPGTNMTVTVSGFNVPFGPQEFFVVYEFVSETIILENPTGGEVFAAFDNTIISWSATDNSTNPFTLEFFDGTSWTVINNNIPGTSDRFVWSTPNVPSGRCKIRISRNGTGTTATTPGDFTILQQPGLTLTSPCEGYADLNWTAVTGATDYEVFQVVNGALTPIAVTATTNFRAGGLDRNTSYWFTVRARITDSVGMRARARLIKPAGTSPCTDAAFDNDLKIDTLLAPANGRLNTSTQLSAAQQITVRIKNLDNSTSSSGYNVSYQVNSNPVVTENTTVSIAAGGTVDYTFTTPANLSAINTYNIRVFVKQTGDLQIANDEKTYTIKHADNQPVILPFTENFEGTLPAQYKSNVFALTNADRFDFFTANSNGRMSTFINSGFAINGNRSVTLDATQFNFTKSNNSLTGTINLSNYSATDGLRLDFVFKNHGQIKQPTAGVWMRGSDAQPWVQVYDLVANQGMIGNIKQVSANINELGQPITSSFQVRFDQQGDASANNNVYDADVPDQDDGFSFDDIRIVVAANDVMAVKILSPDTLNCSLGNAAITVRIKNTTSVTYNNVPVFYRINNGVPVADVIPVLNPGETDYTFATTANFTDNRAYKIDAWVKNTGDDYAVNDSTNNYYIYNSPVINTFPYLERFETSNGNWFTDTLSYSSWRWGKPAKAIASRSASETKGWFTTLSSSYKQNENSYLYSPCFDLSGLTQPTLSFSHIFQQEDNCNCDYHTAEYSKDNGNTWLRLSTVAGGTNWFDSSNLSWRKNLQRWHVSSADIPTPAPSIRFRFILSSDEFTQGEGIGIDDIHVFDKATIYTGADVLNINQTVSGSNWTNFTSGGNLVAAINPLGQNLGSTDVSVYINTGAVRFTSSQYYLDRNLVVKTTNPLTDSVLVRFYFTEQEAARLITATGCGTCTSLKDAYLAGVTKFNGTAANENGTLADNVGNYQFILPANVDVVPFNNGYYAEFKVRSFSELWINGGGVFANQPLPLTLISFNASKHYPDAQLQWQTANEENTSRFEVERKLNNDNDFVTVGTVAAKGNASQTWNYSFTDKDILPKGTRFTYRLKMIDNDGKFTYSNTIQLVNDPGKIFIRNIYYTPGNSQLIIGAGNLETVKEMNIRIINNLGQPVLNRRYTYQDTRVETGNLPAGSYMMEIRNEKGSEVYRYKFIKL
jgi:Subtilase family